MSNNKLNNFDQLLKSKMDKHSVPFSESDWASLEKNLPKKIGKPLFKNPWLWSGAAAIALVVTSVLVLNTSTENSTTIIVATNEDNTNIDNSNPTTPTKEKEQVNITSDKKELTEDNKNSNADNSIIENNKVQHGNENHSNNNSNINDTETIASNNKTEATSNHTESAVDSSLSPAVTPEKFIEIASVRKPEAHISCAVTEQCAGKKFSFSTNNQKDVDFLWSFGDDSFSKEQNPSHVFEKAGSYKVGLIVRSKIDNSVLTNAKEVLVHVLALPNVNFEYEETLNQGIPSISFINTTDKANKWSWNLGDGNVSMEKDPYHNYRRKGNYNVSLTAISNEGCTSTKKKKVYIENDYNLLAPNSFTPNGDGINDFFIPEALKIMDVEFSMSIFSQSDGLLFESKSVDTQWDGINNQNGEKCKEGNYIWVVTLTNKTGQTEQYKGAVLILE